MLRLIYWIYFFKFNPKKIDEYYRRIMIRLANYSLRGYFNISGWFYSKQKLPKAGQDRVIVSITSYPARINTLWLVLETLLNQSYKPDKIVVWLYEGEFSGRESLPDSLMNLEKRGVDIQFCDENLYPHKKYFYSIREYPHSIVITVDDDMLFHPDLIKNLMKCHKIHRNAVCCSILRKMEFRGGELEPYEKWKYVNENTPPRFINHLMGGGGTLFPPGSLHSEVFNIKNIKKLALKTDDLWLKIMSLKQETKVASVAGEYKRFFIPVILKGDRPLMNMNIHENKNDKNFRQLVDYYRLDLNKFLN